MTVYISRRAKIKFNIRVYYEDARNFLLLIISFLSIAATGLFIACMVLYSGHTHISIEAGERIFAEDYFGVGARFGEDYDPNCIYNEGVYYFTALIDGKEESVRLSVKDTKAPRVTVRDIYIALARDGDGNLFLPTPEDFIESIDEAGDYMGEFLTDFPDMKRPGEYKMQVRYADSSGNKTEVFDVKMIQIYDNEPPVLDVSPLIIVPVGGAIEYKPYVILTDNCVGKLSFEADESGLDLGKVGEYKVYITGTDQAGNKSERAEVTVNVVESYDGEKLDKMLDGIVEKLDVEGKSREQICREIYKYVRKELDYTGDSQKGDARRAAYYALLGGGGDCYSYFSLSKLLLDRCGIESLDIERLPTKSAETHFWSLVNIGEGEEQRWYHFDSTELRADRYEHSGCLLTEKQINAYSKARADFYLYDTSLYPKTAEEIITPTPRLEELY